MQFIQRKKYKENVCKLCLLFSLIKLFIFVSRTNSLTHRKTHTWKEFFQHDIPVFFPHLQFSFSPSCFRLTPKPLSLQDSFPSVSLPCITLTLHFFTIRLHILHLPHIKLSTYPLSPDILYFAHKFTDLPSPFIPSSCMILTLYSFILSFITPSCLSQPFTFTSLSFFTITLHASFRPRSSSASPEFVLTYRLADNVENPAVEDSCGSKPRRDVPRMLDVNVWATQRNVPPRTLSSRLVQRLQYFFLLASVHCEGRRNEGLFLLVVT